MVGFDEFLNFVIPKVVLIGAGVFLWKIFKEPFSDMGRAIKGLFSRGKAKITKEEEIVEEAPPILYYE